MSRLFSSAIITASRSVSDTRFEVRTPTLRSGSAAGVCAAALNAGVSDATINSRFKLISFFIFTLSFGDFFNQSLHQHISRNQLDSGRRHQLQ